jgi:hypothetical protein
MSQIPATMSTPAVQVAQVKKERQAQVASRGGVASANPPSTNLPPSVKLESSQPAASMPVTGKVPFSNPVDSPRMAEANRTVNNLPPTMSVQLTEGFINEAAGGHMPLTPNLIARDGNQVLTDARPLAPADAAMSGSNPVGSGPIINPQQPTVTPPVVSTPAPEGDFE